MKILNLTQHPATQDQIAAGVIDLKGEQLKMLKSLLTFDDIPSVEEIENRAHDIALLVMFNGLGNDDDDPSFLKAMIGGAPYLMSALENALKSNSVVPVYAFSERMSVEEIQPDGSVRKLNKFKHKGFVEV